MLANLEPEGEDIEFPKVSEEEEEEEGSNDILVENGANNGDQEEDKSKENFEGDEEEEEEEEEVQLVNPPTKSTMFHSTNNIPNSSRIITIPKSTSSRHYDKFKTSKSHTTGELFHQIN